MYILYVNHILFVNLNEKKKCIMRSFKSIKFQDLYMSNNYYSEKHCSVFVCKTYDSILTNDLFDTFYL